MTTNVGTTETSNDVAEFGWPAFDVPDTTGGTTTGVEVPSACTDEPPTPVGSCYAQEIVDIVSNSVAIGDFDGDGHLDLAATDEAETGVLLLRGDGTGTLAAPTPFALASENQSQGDLARFQRLATMHSEVADRLFLTSSLRLAGEQLWWSNMGEVSVSWFMADAGPHRGGVFGDLDGDGDDDVVVVGPNLVFESLCDAVACEEPMGMYPQFLTDQNVDASLLDFDEDGRADLIAVYRGAGVRIQWWRNEGDGVFAIEPTEVGLPHQGDGDQSWAFVDLDGNEHADLVFADRHEDAGWTQLHTWRRLPDGSFGDAGYVDDVGDVQILTGVDLEGDGVAELVQLQSNALTIWGDSEGAALARIGDIDFGEALGSMATGDLDEDGMLDFALPIVSPSGSWALLLIRSGA